MQVSLLEVGAAVLAVHTLGAICWYAWRNASPVETLILLKLSDTVDLLIPKMKMTPHLHCYPRRTLKLNYRSDGFKLSSKFVQVSNLRRLPRITMFDEKEQPLCIIIAQDGSVLTCIYNRSLHAWRVFGPVHEKFI